MKFRINHKSPVPLHAQAEEILRKLIAEEEYQNGKRLPNEVDLAKILAVSRSTLRYAINKLVQEGLLVRKKRIGTIVNRAVVTSKADNWLSFSQEMELRGTPVQYLQLQVSKIFPDEHTANFFQLKRHRKILQVKSVRGIHGKPIAYFLFYFHPDILLKGNENFASPLYEMLASKYGIIAALSKEEIQADAADADLAEILKMKIANPVLVKKRYVYNQDNLPVLYNIGYFKAESYTYSVERRLFD